MARMFGSGLTATLTVSSSQTITVLMTSFSFESGDRPMVDITGGTDARRISVAGLQDVGSGSLTGVLDTTESTGANATTIQAIMQTCEVVTLTVESAPIGASCTVADIISSRDVHITSFSVETSLDEAVTLTINFSEDFSAMARAT